MPFRSEGQERLIDITKAAQDAGIHRTPTFLINGKVTDAATWEQLEPRAQTGARQLAGWKGGLDRLRIRRLKLSGFKSFVESTELRVEPGLTGIVGPNGCGKSNLLEAIRWVMGEGSPKSLRGGGMDDVIFAGTATRPQRDFAEVSVLLDRDAKDEAGPGDSEVTRRIERGAGSAYRIDGRDVRAKDVALLFADAATGAHSPALVSQGKVGSIISAKPVERRLLLEEAAGISGLHARRKDAEQKLRATEANLARLGEILGEQEQRAAQLRRQARAAERYRKLTAEIRSLEARVLHARWLEAEQATAAANAEAQSAEDEVATIQADMAEAHKAQDEAAQVLAERRNALTEVREAGHALAHELATARARRDTVARRLAELDRLDASLGADIAREEALQRDAAAAMAQLDQEQAAIERRLSDGEVAVGADRRRAHRRRDRVARGRGRARRIARAAGGDARRAPGRRRRARSRAGPARAHRPGAGPKLASSSTRSATAASMTRRAPRPRRKPLPPRPLWPRPRRREPRQSRAARVRRTTAIRPRARLRQRVPLCPPRSPSMTRSPARSNMAEGRQSPTLPPNPAMSARSQRLWARMPMRRSAAIRRAAGRAATSRRTILPCRRLRLPCRSRQSAIRTSAPPEAGRDCR